ncbi:MAG: WbuC family cupin fold metalloprotein [Chloroflexi bacterium]|nr:WbuC family cupin fold metalloprotein [Chloroflexota bacterium]
MRTITQDLLDTLLQEAAQSPRRRTMYRLHEHHEPVQRMVNAMLPGSYAPPHKHEQPDKVELFAALMGRAACLHFHDDGSLRDIIIVEAQGTVRAVDIPARVYHSVVALTPCALLEIIQGPYDAATHKKFPAWAPGEADPQAAAYLRRLEAQIAKALSDLTDQ